LKIHPRGRTDMPLVGLYATRTNLRPNQIGLTVVELLKVEGSTLTVRGLDAYDGSPVLDVKPYDSWDSKPDARVPEWRNKLEEENKLK
jgi:tRNA (adenine37-N6)-methyltransferase